MTFEDRHDDLELLKADRVRDRKEIARLKRELRESRARGLHYERQAIALQRRLDEATNNNSLTF